MGRLKISYEFKKQSEASEQHLRSFILEVNNKFNQVASHETITPDYEDEDIYQEFTVEDVEQNVDSDNEQVTKLNLDVLSEADIVKIKEDCSVDIDEVQEDEAQDDEQDEEEQYEDIEAIDAEILDNEEEHIEENNSETSFVYVVTNKPKQQRPRSKVEPGSSNMCTKCNRDFSTKTNLIRHMKTHDGHKPFKCTVCDSSFTQNGSLKQHMHIHTGERPFTCHICNRGFTQCKSLTFHMRRHTGEKPYPCDHCGLSFRQKDGLKVNSLVLINHHFKLFLILYFLFSFLASPNGQTF